MKANEGLGKQTKIQETYENGLVILLSHLRLRFSANQNAPLSRP
jgi:hypothetical protein